MTNKNFYDATQPYNDIDPEAPKPEEELWLSELLHNGIVVGTIQANNPEALQKLIDHWTRS